MILSATDARQCGETRCRALCSYNGTDEYEDDFAMAYEAVRRYQIRPWMQAFSVSQALGAEAWRAAEAAQIDCFPWRQSGRKQATEVRLLYEPEALHLLFVAEDAHSFALARELNGKVCKDSCVEFFANPWPDEGSAYFNCEVNCCGALHLGFRSPDGDTRYVTRDQAARIGIRSSLPGPAKDESPDDAEWRLYLCLPCSVLSDLCGREVAFAGRWRGNFYRCGGRTEPQHACWNPIGAPRPSFHRPAEFGELQFV